MKSYGQWCGVAKALDVVGERWTLLVVRELLEGPKRYTDLRDGIPGIATDVLAARLRDLEELHVVNRRTLLPPAASKVYELTELGQGLEPVVRSLARWGMQLLGARDKDEAFRPQWLAMGLRVLVRQDRAEGVELDVEFVLGPDEAVRIRVDGGDLHYIAEPNTQADVTVHADLGTLVELAGGALLVRDAIATGRLHVSGTGDAIRAYRRLFSQPVHA